jgi:hypothetical protein
MQTKTIEIAREVIVSTTVHVPVSVDSVGGRVSSIAGVFTLLFRLECTVETLAALERIIATLATYLASGLATATSTATPIASLTTTTKAPSTRGPS